MGSAHSTSRQSRVPQNDYQAFHELASSFVHGLARRMTGTSNWMLTEFLMEESYIRYRRYRRSGGSVNESWYNTQDWLLRRSPDLHEDFVEQQREEHRSRQRANRGHGSSEQYRYTARNTDPYGFQYREPFNQYYFDPGRSGPQSPRGYHFEEHRNNSGRYEGFTPHARFRGTGYAQQSPHDYETEEEFSDSEWEEEYNPDQRYRSDYYSRPSPRGYRTEERQPSGSYWYAGFTQPRYPRGHSTYSGSASRFYARAERSSGYRTYTRTPRSSTGPSRSHSDRRQSRSHSSRSQSHHDRQRSLSTSPPRDAQSPQGPDHYAVLGVSRSATTAEITRAYRALSLRHHPDRVAPSERAAATARMVEINRAREVLGDPEMRERYDRAGRVGRE